jgi:hypothetical protein
MTGTSLGPYQIAAKLGEGGMVRVVSSRSGRPSHKDVEWPIVSSRLNPALCTLLRSRDARRRSGSLWLRATPGRSSPKGQPP